MRFRFLPSISCHSFRQSHSISLIETKPWPSDKSLVSVETEVNADMEQKAVLELDSAVWSNHLKAKPSVIVGTWKCVC